MARGYGFSPSDDKEEELQLPPPKQATSRDPASVADLAREGARLGFISREPVEANETHTKRQGRGRRRPAQAKLLIAGRKDVLDQFQEFCWGNDLPYWEGLKVLLEEHRSQTDSD